jgi:hypothetical protein
MTERKQRDRAREQDPNRLTRDQTLVTYFSN